MDPPLLDLNPALDVAALAKVFARDRRVQVRNVLTDASARAIHGIATTQTPWGLSWQAGSQGPEDVREATLAAMPPAQRQVLGQAAMTAMARSDYAFAFSSYPLVDAYLGKWAPGGPHDQLLEYINGQPVMELVRAITGMTDLIKADGKLTLFRPTHFLSVHNDQSSAAARRIAYVLSLCAQDWRPDWGGYLNFYDDEGDVIAGWRPRFNALNLFTVPQQHNVTFLPPYAPVARYAITGWFRNK